MGSQFAEILELPLALGDAIDEGLVAIGQLRRQQVTELYLNALLLLTRQLGPHPSQESEWQQDDQQIDRDESGFHRLPLFLMMIFVGGEKVCFC